MSNWDWLPRPCLTLILCEYTPADLYVVEVRLPSCWTSRPSVGPELRHSCTQGMSTSVVRPRSGKRFPEPSGAVVRFTYW
ncbi:hypothetical protein DAEQUDRAFT_721892 [Daedalea quercina L-15889]|uniref:Uncharacterized protein n=1 Tax=Daedalea quercina L-15889 TaxID=1314783 RepID=A0A165TDV4_9APHY|nr:hypothetical protein DAEQUDRAFT_721892 [Daedalea quercina L-15889]